MNLLYLALAFTTGVFLGAGLVLFYVKMKFTQSLQKFEQEMDFLKEMEDEIGPMEEKED